MLNNNQKQKREGVFKQMSKITPLPPCTRIYRGKQGHKAGQCESVKVQKITG